MASPPGSPNEDDGEPVTGLPPGLRDMTLKDILAKLHRGKKTGVPMPSTVQRRKERLKRKREERERTRAAAAGESGDGPPSENGNEENGNNDEVSPQPKRTATSERANAPAEADANDAEHNPDVVEQIPEVTVVAPKVIIDEDGNIVIDKESLVVRAGAAPTADTDHIEPIMVDNNAMSKHITSASFAKREASVKWTADDDEKFFEALSRYGTDFSLIEHVFPDRSRRQIKLKFKREERKNRARLDACLKARASVNISEVRKQFGLKGDAPPLPSESTTPITATVDNLNFFGQDERNDDDSAPLMSKETDTDINLTCVNDPTTPRLDVSRSMDDGEEEVQHKDPDNEDKRNGLDGKTGCEIAFNNGADDDDDDDDNDDDDDSDDEAVNLKRAVLGGGHSISSGLGGPQVGIVANSNTTVAAHTPEVVADNADDDYMDDYLAHQQY